MMANSNDRQSRFQFKFDGLPENTKLDSLTVTVTRRTGEPKHLPFRLQDIPLVAAKTNQ